MKQRVILIVGLRRSGTTAIWRAFQLDDRITSFNEPFNPQILNLNSDDFSGGNAYNEFGDLVRKNSVQFWASYAPIDNIYELRAKLSDEQGRYLEYLAEQGKHVLFEMTRVHYKLEDLARLFPGALLVHLYRPAASFATSIMLPNPNTRIAGKRGFIEAYRVARAKLAKTVRKRSFWRSKYSGNMWGFDSLIGSSQTDAFASRLNRYQIDGDLFYRLPAVARLLGYWRVSFEEVETNGRRLFGDSFVSLSFNEFCSDPETVMRNLYSTAGIAYTKRNLNWIHKPHGAYQSGHKKWIEYANLVGLDRALL